jgi:integrase
MARKATGQVIAPKGKQQRSWAIRFPAYGKRQFVTLGRPEDGWTREKAEEELQNVLADVRRGIWRPEEPAREPEAPRATPTFHEFASEWLRNREPELRPKSVASYRWQLTNHLLPTFAPMRLDAIDPENVDRFKAAKLREGAIGPNQINKCLGTLARILKAARRYGHVERNPLEHVDRLRGTRPRRPTPDPEQLPALLDRAGALRPIVATMAGAGLRVGEAVALNWRDVNLASGSLRIGAAKTEAGVRSVDLPLALREELSDHKARSTAAAAGDPVFCNREGRRQTVSNVERRFKTAIRRANERLEELDVEPFSQAATPHSLRRLYASVRYALGDDPVYVGEQMGHADSGALSMRMYARAVRRRERLTGAALREFDRALEWARMGRVELETRVRPSEAAAPDSMDTASQSRKLAPGPDSSVG